MIDPLAGRYHKEFKREFALAKELVAPIGGSVEPGKHNYEAFIYTHEDVRILFYPHKTTAGNYHLRVRDHGSKNKSRAVEIMKMLDDGAGYNCTFQRSVNARSKK